LDVTLEQHYSVLDTLVDSRMEFGNEKGRTIKKAFVKNISGSGACLILDEEPDRDKVLDVTITLNPASSIRVFAKIIRIIKNEKKFEVGVHFIKLSPHDSDILVKFIFEQQRILLKNKR
jgi:c-di-GMP-binding flagellar brake protein YcgR